jgi:hypothetical protein
MFATAQRAAAHLAEPLTEAPLHGLYAALLEDSESQPLAEPEPQPARRQAPRDGEQRAALASHAVLVARSTAHRGWGSHTVTWRVRHLVSGEDEKEHVLQLTHSTLTGRRRLLVDGAVHYDAFKFLDSGSAHDVSHLGPKLTVEIVEVGTHFEYFLSVDDVLVE